MREVPHGDLLLNFDAGEERTLVVDPERKDAMLIGRHEGGTIDGAVCRVSHGLEGNSMEGREHGKL